LAPHVQFPSQNPLGLQSEGKHDKDAASTTIIIANWNFYRANNNLQVVRKHDRQPTMPRRCCTARFGHAAIPSCQAGRLFLSSPTEAPSLTFLRSTRRAAWRGLV